MNYLTSRFNGFMYAVVVVSSLSLFACSEDLPSEIAPEISPAYKSNVVVAFFNEAELQIETLDQRQELTRALQDMLTLKPDELRAKRYANYQLEPNKWTLNDILSRYYYARPPLVFDERLYQDVTTLEAKEKLKQALEKLKKH